MKYSYCDFWTLVRNGTTEGSFDITRITDTNTPGATIKKTKKKTIIIRVIRI